MKELTLPSYGDIVHALGKTTLKLHPSQAHGILCGVLCGHREGEIAWEQLITGNEKNTKNLHLFLDTLYNATDQQLKEFLFEFTLILPDEDDPLPERAEGLTLWCQGFLTGLKFVGEPITEKAKDEATEAIRDLVEIAKMNYEEVVASEEDEVAYVELVEYVRMAVILIYQEKHEDSSPNQSKHLH